MHIHGQFSVEHRQFGMLVEGHEIFVNLVAGGRDNLHRPAAADALLERPDGGERRRAADIARAVIAVDHLERTLPHLADELSILREVGIVVSLRIVESVRHHDAAAIDALPEAHGEGVAFFPLIERFGAPLQFLRREADEAAVSRQCGQRVAESEAVGQEDVRALGVELRSVERLSEEHIPEPSLRRAHDGLVGIPAAACDVPPSVGDVVFQLLILLRIVLFHPRILHPALEVEHIVRILLEEEEVLRERVEDMVADSGLDVPVPLRVEMRIGHHIGFHLFVLGKRAP